MALGYRGYSSIVKGVAIFATLFGVYFGAGLAFANCQKGCYQSVCVKWQNNVLRYYDAACGQNSNAQMAFDGDASAVSGTIAPDPSGVQVNAYYGSGGAPDCAPQVNIPARWGTCDPGQALGMFHCNICSGS